MGTNIRVYPRESAANFRWVICGLLFFAATINYIDRQVIGILKTTIHDEIGWSEVDYSWSSSHSRPPTPSDCSASDV